MLRKKPKELITPYGKKKENERTLYSGLLTPIL
jgi:hypothetical protein